MTNETLVFSMIGVYESNERELGNEEMHIFWCEKKQLRGGKHVLLRWHFERNIDTLRVFFDSTLFFTIAPNDEYVFNFN